MTFDIETYRAISGKLEVADIDFAASQAKTACRTAGPPSGSPDGRLRRFWAPVGSGVMPDEDVEFLRAYLFGGGEGRVMAERIERRVDRLPGLEGLDLMRAAVSQAA